MIIFMKEFKYEWTTDIFLIHVQLSGFGNSELEIDLIREYEGGKAKEEKINIAKNTGSYRFIVSRTHPKEKEFIVKYPNEVILEAFKIDDRAYYPTESFFMS